MREGPFARTQVGNHHGLHQLQQSLGQPLPRPPGHVVPPEFTRQLIEVATHFVAALFQHQAQGAGIFCSLGNFPRRLADNLHYRSLKLMALQPIKTVLALAPVFHQTSLLQLRQVRRDPALPHGKDFLQFSHRKLFPFHQQQQTQPGRVGDQF